LRIRSALSINTFTFSAAFLPRVAIVLYLLSLLSLSPGTFS
jgi:hypothetical protein